EDRKAGSNQSDKLLIEKDKVFRLYGLPALLRPERERPTLRTDVNRKQTLLLKVVANFFHVLSNNDGAYNLARGLRVFAVKFHMKIDPLPLGEGRVRVSRFAKTCDPHPALRAALSQRERSYCPSPCTTSTPGGTAKSKS